MSVKDNTPAFSDEVMAAFRLTGSIGGKKRAASLTPARRRRIAMKAAKASAEVRRRKKQAKNPEALAS